MLPMRIFTLLMFATAGAALAGDAAPTREQIEFFESKVRPVLAEHCYSCHSVEAKKNKGGLRMDSRAALLKGGDTGPALVPGEPDKSLIIRAITHVDDHLKMPPAK